MKITKAVIPVAGFGTRFLPASKSIPKEMFPIVDKPIIHYIVEELVEAGITDIILVTNIYKKAIEDYFFPHHELESLLEANGKTEELEKVKKLSNMANFIFVRQKKMDGTGNTILAAKSAIGNEPFLFFFGDDLFVSKISRTKQMIAAFNKYQSTILAAMRIEDPEGGLKYGFADGTEVEKGTMKVNKFIEKPGFGKAPSTYAITSRLYTSDIFEALEEAKKDVPMGKELYDVYGVNVLMKTKPVYAVELKDTKYFDTGNKLSYLKTCVELGLMNEEIGPEFKKYLKTII